MKIYKLLSILVLALVALSGLVMASDYQFTSLKVNGVESSNLLHVQPGESLKIDYILKGLSATPQDVKVRAWLGGYEYSDIIVTSEAIKVDQGVSYSKSLVLNLPNDLDTGSNVYTLRVEAFDQNDMISETFNIFVEEPRHNLDIMDVIFTPGQSVEAGENLYVKARVENSGYKQQKDIRVTVSIPELAISSKEYIDCLDARNSEQNSENSPTLLLQIPKDVQTGFYEMNVQLSYNKGYTSHQVTEIVKIEGKLESAKDSNTLVSFDLSNTELNLNEQEVFNVIVANMDSDLKVYSLEVSDVSAWAESKLEPGLVTVSQSSTGMLAFKVNAQEEGSYQFLVTVKEDGFVIAEKNYSVDVEPQKTSRFGLWLFTGTLLVVLIVLIIVTQWKKHNQEDFEIEDEYNSLED